MNYLHRTLFFTTLIFFSFCQTTFARIPNQIGTVASLEKNKKKSIRPKRFKHRGDHIVAEFKDATNLNCADQLEQVLREAAEAAGATVLSVTVQKFEPQGMTGVIVLQESHISIHTWPEDGYAAVDVYTCGDHVRVEDALAVLQQFFKPKKINVVSITRGF